MVKEPLFFIPIYKSKPWGKDKIKEELNRKIEINNIGESWELSAHKDDISYLNNYDNTNLLDLFNNKKIKEDIFGTKCKDLDKFPLLIKFIDANSNLSIQVHPDDNYAKIKENDLGKNEVWYVMDVNPNTNIIYGLNDKAKDISNKEIVNNIINYINYEPINKGDFIIIPSGTIHSMLSGTFICEIQQSSDITYRVYDWNRNDYNRPLHIDKAIDVIKNNEKKIINCNNLEGNIYLSNNFNVDIINVNSNNKYFSYKESFIVYIVVEGKGNINTNNCQKDIEKGSVFLIPSNLGNYELSGNMKLLKVYL